MTETRRLSIRRKRFGRRDLCDLFEILRHEIDASREARNEYAAVSVQLECADGTEYEAETATILGEGKEIDKKRVEEIQMRYRDGRKGRSIQVRLSHGSRDGKASVSGGSEDEWVKATHIRIRELVDSVPPSESWFTRHPTMLFCILAGVLTTVLALTAYTWWIIEAGLSPDIPRLEDAGEQYWSSKLDLAFQVKFGVWFFVALTFADSIRDWILKAWPNVDLDVGPQQLRSEKLIRGRIATFVTAILIPFVWLAISLLLR